MRYCIFCKNNSDKSKSVEHIIPESLGNKLSTLPIGIVCDKCNNYFAVKIEKDVLALPFFKSLRSRNRVKSKKGKIPLDVGYLPTGSEVEVDINSEKDDKNLKVIIPKKSDFEKLLNGRIKEFYIPEENTLKKDKLVSRFLAKIAIEAIALKFWESTKTVDYLITESKFDRLRNYARFGAKVNFWEYHQRQIYNEIPTDLTKQKKYEFNIWSTENDDNALGLHLTLVLYGMELTINLFEISTDRYEKWLEENDNKMPI